MAQPNTKNQQARVNTMSLSSIAKLKELEQNKSQKSTITEIHESEPYTEEQLWKQWDDFAARLLNKGEMLKHSLLKMSKPRLIDGIIWHELPNKGTAMDFESLKPAILNHLRSALKNHNIDIKIEVNEEIIKEKAFSVEEKAERFKEINDNFDLLRKMLDLEI